MSSADVLPWGSTHFVPFGQPASSAHARPQTCAVDVTRTHVLSAAPHCASAVHCAPSFEASASGESFGSSSMPCTP